MLFRRRVCAGTPGGPLAPLGAPTGPCRRAPASCWLNHEGARSLIAAPFCLSREYPLSFSDGGVLWGPAEQAPGFGPHRGNSPWAPLQRWMSPRSKRMETRQQLLRHLCARSAFGLFCCLHAGAAEQQQLQHQQPRQQQQEEEQNHQHTAAEIPALRLSRVVVLNKVTRFEVSLAEKMAMWRREHLSRGTRISSSSSSRTAAAAAAHGEPWEDPTLYTPGSRAYEAAAAAAEAAAAAALARDFPSAYRTHVLHQKTADEVYRQLRENYGLHVTVIKARTMQGISITKRGAVALPPDAVISAGGFWTGV